MMKAASISETSVNFYQITWRNILQDSHIHTHRRENLKFHLEGKMLGDEQLKKGRYKMRSIQETIPYKVYAVEFPKDLSLIIGFCPVIQLRALMLQI
jgi:hypothetical protein